MKIKAKSLMGFNFSLKTVFVTNFRPLYPLLMELIFENLKSSLMALINCILFRNKESLFYWRNIRGRKLNLTQKQKRIIVEVRPRPVLSINMRMFCFKNSTGGSKKSRNSGRMPMLSSL